MRIMHSNFFCFVLMAFVNIAPTRGDTPANCSYEDIKGSWTFSIGPGGNDRTLKCNRFTVKTKIKFTFDYPNIAKDQYGNNGTWIMIYNQGFEASVAGRKYFAFSKYTKEKSFCHEVTGGWSHDLLGNDWACYSGQKSSVVIKDNVKTDHSLRLRFQPKAEINSDEMVNAINEAGLSWTAKKYPQFEGLTRDDFIAMTGGKTSQGRHHPKPTPLTEDDMKIFESLPKQFDWRDVDGINYVSPVRNQLACGSCYAFAAMAMAEARYRIMTNNSQTPVFSPQDIMECSDYSQGCRGGLAYLIGGNYAQDFGLVEEYCNKYKGTPDTGPCHTKKSCARYYASSYGYVGGYFGACNEARMMKAIHEGGPIVIGFEVYTDFASYKSGIYHHKFEIDEQLGLRFDPFELTNHNMVIVGWGENDKNQKYWIVKNSWGNSWGSDGYCWISKGNDECGIESAAVEASPIFRPSD